MLYWAVVFFSVAIVAGVPGFAGIAGAATLIAPLLYFIFLVIFLVALPAGLARASSTTGLNRSVTNLCLR